MKFPGFLTVSANDGVQVEATVFDDTELSDHSEWIDRWENEPKDLSQPHGSTDAISMLEAVCQRIASSERPCEGTRQSQDSFDTWNVRTMGDLARLALLVIAERRATGAIQPRAWSGSWTL